ncbi:MAG: hypothetical protein KKA62_01845 [Nanoarchaeota archaeon]|nr:hypothetical protein [Nanoarchaeota archaeon]MBU1643824.1 hypothetical protein [Nanoarchaeota archaeon]MBU1976676.1 hypothetical protein [Nanoarchaeota archaeon]
MTLEEILISIEKCYVEIIRPSFSGDLSDNISSQIRTILEEQFKSGVYSEVGGSIFYHDEGLEMRIVKPKIMEHIDKALTEFEGGNYDNFPSLASYSDKMKESFLKYSERNPDKYLFIDLINECCQTFLKENNLLKNITEDIRKNFVDLYKKYIVGRTYFFLPSELGFSERNFIGIFHVHVAGSKPSIMDLDLNKRIRVANLLISTTEKYEQEGVSLYLIHSESYEQIYEGLLKQK